MKMAKKKSPDANCVQTSSGGDGGIRFAARDAPWPLPFELKNNSPIARIELLSWRRRWDSNPRDLAAYLISSQARYDHFDTSPKGFHDSSKRQNVLSYCIGHRQKSQALSQNCSRTAEIRTSRRAAALSK